MKRRKKGKNSYSRKEKLEDWKIHRERSKLGTESTLIKTDYILHQVFKCRDGIA